VISRIDPAWITRRLAVATPANTSRGLLVAAIINLGALSGLAPSLSFTPEQAREWFDQGDPLPPEIANALTQRPEIVS